MHLGDNLLGLFGTEVRLVVLLVVVFVLGAFSARPVHLHLDEVLVLLLVNTAFFVSFTHLVLLLFNRVDEICLFRFA